MSQQEQGRTGAAARAEAERLGQKAEDKTRDARAEATNVVDEARGAARDVADEARATGRALKDEARGIVSTVREGIAARNPTSLQETHPARGQIAIHGWVVDDRAQEPDAPARILVDGFQDHGHRFVHAPAKAEVAGAADRDPTRGKRITRLPQLIDHRAPIGRSGKRLHIGHGLNLA